MNNSKHYTFLYKEKVNRKAKTFSTTLSSFAWKLLNVVLGNKNVIRNGIHYMLKQLRKDSILIIIITISKLILTNSLTGKRDIHIHFKIFVVFPLSQELCPSLHPLPTTSPTLSTSTSLHVEGYLGPRRVSYRQLGWSENEKLYF